MIYHDILWYLNATLSMVYDGITMIAGIPWHPMLAKFNLVYGIQWHPMITEFDLVCSIPWHPMITELVSYDISI